MLSQNVNKIYAAVMVVFLQGMNCQHLTVNTTLGMARGMQSDYKDGPAVYEFLGVPYASSPEGENRFQPPRPAKPWGDGITYFYDYGASCLQNESTLAEYINDQKTTDEGFKAGISEMSEDCLFLNIYTPWSREGVLFPVMVYIHGGDFSRGAGKTYKGAKLAGDNSVVVVNMNYRLGAFGFLSSPENDLAGNYGMLDQLEAIKWVKNHIEAFGGDPRRITIFGEEAGGSSIHLHTLSPKSRGLFTNAIIQSATYNDGLWDEQQADSAYQAFVSSISVPSQLSIAEHLRNISIEEILNSSVAVSTWRPCVSPNFVERFPSEIMSEGNFSGGINIMIGSNSGSGQTNNVDPNVDDWLVVLTESVVQTAFPQMHGKLTTNELDKMSTNYVHYYAGFQDEGNEPWGSYAKHNFIDNLVADQLYFTWAQEISSEMSRKEDISAYQYRFSVKSSSTFQSEPSVSDELPYIFGYDVPGPLSMDIMKYWTNFAKFGNPNSNVTTMWPEYKTSSENSSTCRARLTLDTAHYVSHDDVNSRNWNFWETYYNAIGFSCNQTTSVSDPTDINCVDPANPSVCEATVGEIFGIDLSNEAAGIMMFVFISISGFFIICLLAACCCVLKFKRALKKEIKKHKRPSLDYNFDNPSCSKL